MTDAEGAYDFIFLRCADGILLADGEGVLLRINPAAAAMLDVTVEAVWNKRVSACFPHNAALLNLFNRAGEQTLDVRLPRRRLAVGTATTLPRGERLVLLHDVTEQRDLDSRRQTLIGTIAHDLRNPISAIGGFVDLIAKVGDLNEQQERFLNRARQTINKVYDVGEALIDLAWIEAGMPLRHVAVRMPGLIEQTVDKLAPFAQERQLALAVSVQHPLPLVMGDPDRLRQVVHHLLHNAILYSLPEHSVVIHAWGDERDLYCAVADQGIGIADDEIELIFDRLYRSRDERVRDLPGGGVGLTIARRIIARHGGDLWAASNLGKGSTFTFVLPAVPG